MERAGRMSAPPAGEEIVVHVRLFAMLRERARSDSVELRLAAGATVADALAALAEHDALRELLARLPVRMAVNRDYASERTALREGDELALIPPVSGGARSDAPAGDAIAGRPHVAVSAETLSAERLTQAVGDPRAGAIVLFEGVTREVDSLDYEAYVEMARERIELILADCMRAHGACRAAAEHRVGSVALGEPSVIVAVSAPHREEAFAAARDAIDRIKREAPIWKRERSGEEGRWVGGTAPAEGRS
jgi:MoaE-MoaD fusion protein